MPCSTICRAPFDSVYSRHLVPVPSDRYERYHGSAPRGTIRPLQRYHRSDILNISLLSTNITIRELISLGGDVHHVFPKQYLINNHYAKNQYNQDANYAYLDRPVNESIGKKSPKEYFSLALEQCQTKVVVCGSITDEEILRKNLAMNCIPSDIFKMDQNDYIHFLEVRRLLMANKIRKYYESL